jgi:hypothetical protein
MRPKELLNHLVGEREQVRRHVEAERFRGLEIDHQVEFVGAWIGRSASAAF